jgi:hypothetical protein
MRFLTGVTGIWTLIMGFMLGCGSHAGKSFVPRMPGYPEANKKEYVLDDDLLEISGLAVVDSNKIAAINDERGDLYFVDLPSGTHTSTKFSGKGDYEELVKTDSAWFILESNGDLHEVAMNSDKHKKYKFDLEKKIEFESMVWYHKQHKLVIISKEHRKRRDHIVAYSFDLATRTFDEEPFFHISFKDIFTKLENFNAECKPSGAAINPVNNKLYIIASVGKLLLVCSLKGEPEKIYKLNPNHFPQPEGISFANNGDMYISNEGLEGKATILKFPHVAFE